MRPPRSPLSKPAHKLAISIDRARCCGFDPEYQRGVTAAAREIANEVVVPGEQAAFFIACGVDLIVRSD